MTKPTFIGLGVQKCATTWIFDVLNDHPNIFVPEKRQLNYFAHNYGYGLQWYLNKFPKTTNANYAAGEFSTEYFHDPLAPIRIKNIYPDIKLLLSLREPVDRLISNHKHEVRVGHFIGPDLSVEAGIKNNPTYIEQGMYSDHLQRWLEYFPREQIHVIFCDDMKTNPDQLVHDLYKFLNVDTHVFTSKSNDKSNPSYVNRSALIESIRGKTYRTFRSLGLEPVWNLARKAGLQKLYRNANRISSENFIPAMQDETKKELKELFSADRVKLEKILNRSLENWK